MADTTTTTYGLTKPEVGGSTDTWGEKINNNSDLLDNLLDGTTPVTGIDINSGTIDGVTIGATSAPTVTNLGSVATADINGGTIDNTTIGGTTPAAGAFTTLSASGDVNFDSNTLFVDASANAVGIGTTSPSHKLSLSTTGTDGIKLGVDSQTYYHIVRPNGDGLYLGADDGNAGGAGADIRFNVKGTERMRIDSNGRVGIGATNPVATLDCDGNAVFNDSGADRDFRVENSKSSFALFVNGDPSSTNANVQVIDSSPSNSQLHIVGDAVSQGTSQVFHAVIHVPVTSSGNKIIFPFISQGNLNSNTVVRVMGHSARFNQRDPKEFAFTFAVGHITSLANLGVMNTGGAYQSIAINGMNVEVSLNTTYTGPTSDGVYMYIEYMTNSGANSLDIANISMN